MPKHLETKVAQERWAPGIEGIHICVHPFLEVEQADGKVLWQV